MRALQHLACVQRHASGPGSLPPSLPLRRHRHRRLAAAAARSQGSSEQPPSADELRQRAQALQREAAALAAALEGLPPAEQAAVLGALRPKQPPPEQQGGETEADPGQPLEEGSSTTGAPSAAAAGEPEFMARLPPELQQQVRAAGLTAAWQRHAAALEEEFGGDWDERSGEWRASLSPRCAVLRCRHQALRRATAGSRARCGRCHPLPPPLTTTATPPSTSKMLPVLAPSPRLQWRRWMRWHES